VKINTVILAAAFLLLLRTPSAQDLAPHHEANFDAERKQANEMFLKGDKFQALPLYTDLERQDSTIAVFAERRASGLIAAADIVSESDPAKSKALHAQAMEEIRRAQKLGDDSDLVRTMLGMEEDYLRAAKTTGTAPTGPVPPGYRTTSANPEVNQLFRDGETAFAKNDTATAEADFKKAAELDPGYYMAKLYAGDSCFRAQDYACAGEWFSKAIALDPNRETAYRYWGDALFKSGHSNEAKPKYEQAIVAEPYVRLSWGGLSQWAGATKTQMGSPAILRPAVTPSGEGSKVTLPQGSPEDTAAWTAYAGCRTDADHNRAKGARRTVDDEMRCLQLTTDTATREISSGKAQESAFGPGLRALMALQRDGMMECWLLLNGADQDILHDYPAFREAHRDLLIAYIDKYVVRQDAGPATERPKLNIQNPI
jgi:tetratricopeptide (TPR) repeat protein